jgi:hypothetical protein
VNEHQATRYRYPKDTPLRNEKVIMLGILSRDEMDISIVYYTAPILLVRAVADDGSGIKEFNGQVIFLNEKKPYQEPPHWLNGIAGEVYFEKQQDGRWRSTSLLPDEPFLLSVEAPGFRPWSQRLSLTEGATQEVEAKLEKR